MFFVIWRGLKEWNTPFPYPPPPIGMSLRQQAWLLASLWY